ncbi:MAG: integrase/recombinase XerC [Chloroflexi bacterium]|jgi:integrase/recombinase XerC|nr:MAG: integrase/recombinase XerC [Chloroflexota bacterium]
MGTLIDEYRGYLLGERNLALPTVRNYLDDLKPLFEFLKIEHIDVSDTMAEFRAFILRNAKDSINREYRRFLLSYLAWLMNTRITKSNRANKTQGHVRSSAVRHLASLRSFFRFLIVKNYMPNAPIWKRGSTTMRGLIPKTGKRLPQVLHKMEAEVIISATSRSASEKRAIPLQLRDAALLEIMYGSGLRLSEVVNIDLDDLDIKNRNLRVRGKGRKERVVPLSRPSVDALAKYLHMGRPHLVVDQTKKELFSNRYGSRLSRRSVQELVKLYAFKAGLDSTVRPHTLRHSFATHLLDGGADIRVVQELLGHSTPTTTQIYTHISPTQARKAYLAAHPRATKLEIKNENISSN